MGHAGDFLELLGPDIAAHVLSYLDDPADFVRLSLLSKSWHCYVVEGSFCRKICTQNFPELLPFSDVVELDDTGSAETGSDDVGELRSLETEHKIYALLAHEIRISERMDGCIFESICASSTDHPDENIGNTLVSNDVVRRRPSYWSSQGQSNPEVPEILKYRLVAKLCIVDEIKIQPFRAFFQFDNPIYSSKAVRFKFGWAKPPLAAPDSFVADAEANWSFDDRNYVWTYTSPEFPMAQKNCLQTFKLPRPVLCLGGILQVELLGRVQKQSIDALYYICVCHVRVVGRPIPASFDVVIPSSSGKWMLKYSPKMYQDCCSVRNSDAQVGPRDEWPVFAEVMPRVWNRAELLNIFIHEEHEFSDEEDVIGEVIH